MWYKNMSNSTKQKMTKDIIPEHFTMTLALVDALPVLFFSGSMILIGRLFSSTLFLTGALFCLISGAVKVLWKVIVVLKKRNIWWMFVQMRIFMPIGFLLLLISLVMNFRRIRLAAIAAAFLHFPSVLFFFVGIAGMAMLIVFAIMLDSSNAKANWIEQLTNSVTQAAFFFGLLFVLL